VVERAVPAQAAPGRTATDVPPAAPPAPPAGRGEPAEEAEERQALPVVAAAVPAERPPPARPAAPHRPPPVVAAPAPAELPPIDVYIGTIEVVAEAPPVRASPQRRAERPGLDAYRQLRSYEWG
jgi:hypothetical protein